MAETETTTSLGLRLARAAGVTLPYPEDWLGAHGFPLQMQELFPVLNRNGADINVAWNCDSWMSLPTYRVTIWEYGYSEYSWKAEGDDLAATVARCLERYWGLEE